MSIRIVGVLCLLGTLTVSLSVTASAELLLNPGFESWAGTTTADNWTVYHTTGTVAPSKGSTFTGTPTVSPRSGTESQRVKLDTAAERGGVYQRFGSTPGFVYTVSVWILTRLTNVTAVEGRLGVDPTGATTPGSNTIWSDAVTGDSAWTLKTLNVTATGSYITVFLDGRHPDSLANQCNVFFDDASAVACTPPAAPTNPAANPSSVCSGASSTLSASVESGCTVDWYTGSCGGTFVGSGTSLVVSPSNTTTYYPRARNITTGCASTNCGTAVTVTVSATPSAPTNPAANPSNINSGQSSTLSASVASACTVDWYTESCGGTLVGSGTSLVVTPGATTTYYPRARNTTTGCVSVSCGTAVTVTVTIPHQPIHYVKYHEGGIHNGLSWDTAFNTIQEAIDVSLSGDEIWVAAGTYTENIVLPSGVALYGGFAGTETDRAQRNWKTNITVLDGNWSGPVIEVAKNASSSTRIDGFTITNGRTICGGGIYCNHYASPVITNNVITGNWADFDGGGIFCNLSSSPVIANNNIWGNAAVNAGGGVRSKTGSPTLANNLITRNSARMGGGICAGDSSTASSEAIRNNTIVSNSAIQGGGIYTYAMSSASIANNIIAFNSNGIRKESGTGAPTLTKNCVHGNSGYNYDGITQGATDITSDPQLASVIYGNYHIQPGSPCRNAGSNSHVVSGYPDIDDQTRIQNTTVDIGADESDGTTWNVNPTIVRVKTDGNDSNNGSTWVLAKKTIQAAIDAASATGGEVWVKAGTYNERIVLRDNVYIYGGFAGTESSRDQRNWAANQTVIDAQAAGSVVTATMLGYRVSTIDGFRLTNGKSWNGAGVFVSNASPTIMNNTITSNASLGNGGGIWLANSLALVKANQVINNSALGYGGGINCHYTNAELSRNNIENNAACMNGCGAFCSRNDSSRLVNNRIIGNRRYGSIGTPWGSALSVDSYSNATMVCNTVADNTQATGAIYAGVYGYLTMYSNIVSFNSSGIVKDTNATVSQTASYTGDPLFVNRSGGNYKLQSGSPCIDTAHSSTAPSEDYDGNARPVDGDSNGSALPDIGCYEYGSGSGYPTPPTSATATPSTICSGASSTLHAYGGSGTTLRWLTGSCNGASVGTGNDLVVYPTSTTTYYARWETALGNSTCVSTTVTVSGTAPPASVGPNQTIDRYGTTNPLGGNTPTPPATGQWSVVSGGTGTFSPSESDPNATFTHTGGDGPIVLRWTVTLGACSSSADLTVTIGRYCLTNGSFDEGFSGDIGTGWTKQTPESGTWAMETTIKHSGVASQRITDAAGSPAYTTWIYQQFNVKPGRVYVPTMWIYRQNLAVPRIGVDPNGGTSFVAGDAAPAQNQWVYRVGDPFTAGSSGVATIGLAAGYQTNSGTVYFDDVAIAPQAPQSTGGSATIYAGQSATLTASGGFGGEESELCWYTGPQGTGTKVGTGTTLIVWPMSTTTYYPRWETNHDCGISADGAPVTITVLSPPEPPTVTSITPSSGLNTGVTNITNLVGTNFTSGASVKLTRTGYDDINATNVVVLNATQITCSLDLTGKKTGLWNVVVTNPNLQSGTLVNGFGVGVSNSLPVVGTNIGSLLHPILTPASLGQRFCVWGEVETIDSSTFWLNDGSGTRIKVFAPGYSGSLVTGDFASAIGTVDASINPPVLVSSADKVRKHN